MSPLANNPNPVVQLDRLTEREREVAHFITQGLSNKQIGQQLSISEGTVKVHLQRIYNKTTMRNRTSLAALIMRAQLSA